MPMLTVGPSLQWGHWMERNGILEIWEHISQIWELRSQNWEWLNSDETWDTEPLNFAKSSLPVEADCPVLPDQVNLPLMEELLLPPLRYLPCKILLILRTYLYLLSLLLDIELDLILRGPQRVKYKVWPMRKCAMLWWNYMTFSNFPERNLGSMSGNEYWECEIMVKETELELHLFMWANEQRFLI